MPTEMPTCLLVCGPRLQTAGLDVQLCERSFAALHVAHDLRAARRAVASQAFDAIIIDGDLADGDGLSLMSAPFRQTDCAYVLAGDQFSREDLRRVLRLGAQDVFDSPVDVDSLVIRLRGLMSESRRRRDQRQRVARLRALSSRVIKDRREVRRRVDLVCRDLVGAYRELALRVNAMEQARDG